MQKLIIVTFVLRALGFVLVLLSLFGHDLILNVFPGLEGCPSTRFSIRASACIL